MAARGTADLAIKIANYCTALESVFTTDSSELVHKIAERVACFLGATFDDRKRIFHDIKEAYSVRSAVVHGNVISAAKLKNIKEVTTKMDEYIRLITNRWINEQDVLETMALGNEALAEYFERLVLE